jgi:hypothetical protein
MMGNSTTAQYIDRLEKLVRMKKTGSLTMSINGKAALLSLENGEIGYIFFKGRRGLAALSLLSEELRLAGPHAVQMSFDTVSVISTDNFLPLTEAVMNRLKGVERTSTQSDIVTDAGALAPIPSVLLTDRIKYHLSEIVVELTGPVGTEICSEVFKATQTLRVAIDAITSELPDTETALAFKNRVRRRLLPLQKAGFRFCVNEISKTEISASARAGMLLTEEVREILEAVLPDFLTPDEVHACRHILKKTDSLRAAVDLITTQIVHTAVI